VRPVAFSLRLAGKHYDGRAGILRGIRGIERKRRLADVGEVLKRLAGDEAVRGLRDVFSGPPVYGSGAPLGQSGSVTSCAEANGPEISRARASRRYVRTQPC
jgi:hypothetical protein